MIDCEPSTAVIFARPQLHRCWSCGKACYGSERAADRVVKQLRRNRKDRKYEGYLHPYVCVVGRVWHIGHTEYED